MTKKEKRQLGRTTAPIGPYAGHKSGKRKRGVSVLKRKPRASAVTIKYVAEDEYGNVVARFDTLTYKRPE